VHGTDLGSFSFTGFGISGVETSVSTTRVTVNYSYLRRGL